MAEEENTFRKIDDSAEPRFGERAMLLVGYTRQEASAIADHAARIGAEGIRLVLLTDAMLAETVGEALATIDQPPDAVPAALPRFVLLSGLSGEEIHGFLNGYGETGLPRPIFASATPSNLTFPVKGWLRELATEHIEMMRLRNQDPGSDG